MRWRMGECTGKVRSTPTPKLTLRTVKVSRTPEPWRLMTTPWNTCTRSRPASTTRTCTLRVAGERARMDLVPPQRHQAGVVVAGPAPGLDQIRAVREGPGQGHGPPP